MGIVTRRQTTWPTENEWYPDAALIVVAFEAFKGRVRADLNVTRTTIVAGEYDQGVVSWLVSRSAATTAPTLSSKDATMAA